ncbi:unnamed protein product [Dibothriocephalus latus]|uniref:NAD(+) kinase n=1 Tax=Dibothriocephalus latus TaxID=60516 RepID=A0A3P7PBL0_DIBLA|nr:unnamed protein product [Dibothriocephalus latus]
MCGAPAVLLSSVLTPLRIFSRTLSDIPGKQLSPLKKALIVSKRSAYEFEQSRSSYPDEATLEKSILEKGKNYDNLRSAHRFHNRIIDELTRCLRAYDVEVRVVHFKHYDFSDAQWSDLILSVGGDGTFLSAASKCVCSVFYLLFSRFWRQRIRLQLTPYVAPLETRHPEIVNIYNISPKASPFRTERRVDELEASSETSDSAPLTRTLPIRALNEVFVSTCMSAR